MSRIFFRNAVMALLTILKWILQAAFMVLKQVFVKTASGHAIYPVIIFRLPDICRSSFPDNPPESCFL